MNIQGNTGDNARNSSGGGQDGQSRAARGAPDETGAHMPPALRAHVVDVLRVIGAALCLAGTYELVGLEDNFADTSLAEEKSLVNRHPS